MEQIFILAGLAITVNKIVTVIKAVGKDNNMVFTQVVVWIVGFAVLALAANAEVTDGLAIPGLDVPLGDMDVGSLLFSALVLGSNGSFAYDLKKAVDNSDTAAEPPLAPTLSRTSVRKD